jgi:ABC-type branched-subunit amino acid transport system ATPase component
MLTTGTAPTGAGCTTRIATGNHSPSAGGIKYRQSARSVQTRAVLTGNRFIRFFKTAQLFEAFSTVLANIFVNRHHFSTIKICIYFNPIPFTGQSLLAKTMTPFRDLE